MKNKLAKSMIISMAVLMLCGCGKTYTAEISINEMAESTNSDDIETDTRDDVKRDVAKDSGNENDVEEIMDNQKNGGDTESAPTLDGRDDEPVKEIRDINKNDPNRGNYIEPLFANLLDEIIKAKLNGQNVVHIENNGNGYYISVKDIVGYGTYSISYDEFLLLYGADKTIVGVYYTPSGVLGSDGDMPWFVTSPDFDEKMDLAIDANVMLVKTKEEECGINTYTFIHLEREEHVYERIGYLVSEKSYYSDNGAVGFNLVDKEYYDEKSNRIINRKVMPDDYTEFVFNN